MKGGVVAGRRAFGTAAVTGYHLEPRMCVMCPRNSMFPCVPAVGTGRGGGGRGDQNDRTKSLGDDGTELEFENKREAIGIFRGKNSEDL